MFSLQFAKNAYEKSVQNSNYDSEVRIEKLKMAIVIWCLLYTAVKFFLQFDLRCSYMQMFLVDFEFRNTKWNIINVLLLWLYYLLVMEKFLVFQAC